MSTDVIQLRAREDLPGDWTLVSAPDRAMDAHLGLLAQQASERLRDVGARREQASRRSLLHCEEPWMSRLLRSIGAIRQKK